MKFTNALTTLLLLLCNLTLSSIASAQDHGGGHVGGGEMNEGVLKNFLGELAIYFKDPISYEVFPEVEAYDRSNKVKFADLILQIEPHIVQHEVLGPFGEQRDCVSIIKDGTRSFDCDASRLPPTDDLKYQPKLYIILLHEVMIHAGIEKPTSETLPSSYPVSSRMGLSSNMSLVTIQKYVPRRSTHPCLLRYIAMDNEANQPIMEALIGKGFILDRDPNSKAKYTFELDLFIRNPMDMRVIYTAYLSQKVKGLALERRNYFFATQKEYALFNDASNDDSFKEKLLKKISKIPQCSLNSQPMANPKYTPMAMYRFYTEQPAKFEKDAQEAREARTNNTPAAPTPAIAD